MSLTDVEHRLSRVGGVWHDNVRACRTFRW